MPENSRVTPVTQQVKNLPVRQGAQEIPVQSLVGEDPLEKEMASHSVFLAGKSHRQGRLAGPSPRDCKGLGTTEREREMPENVLFTFKIKFSKILNVLMTSRNQKFFVI